MERWATEIDATNKIIPPATSWRSIQLLVVKGHSLLNSAGGPGEGVEKFLPLTLKYPPPPRDISDVAFCNGQKCINCFLELHTAPSPGRYKKLSYGEKCFNTTLMTFASKIENVTDLHLWINEFLMKRLWKENLSK